MGRGILLAASTLKASTSQWHASSTVNKFDATNAVELAFADYEDQFEHPFADDCTLGPEAGELVLVVILETGNGGPC